jgi:hypothetical protein
LICGFFWLTSAEATARINIDLATQRMDVESSTSSYSWPVSTARYGYATPHGTFRPYSLQRVHFSRKYYLMPLRHILGRHAQSLDVPHDTGKSTIAYDMAAKISNGDTWPFGEGTADQGAVIILSGEDSRERIIKPRLMAAGANLDQVIMLEPLVKEEGGRRMLNLADDLERIAGLIEELRGQGRVVRMLDIDPISAYLGRSDS